MWPKVHLYHCFKVHCTASYCAAIDEFALVLRVNGRFADFGPETIERLKRRRPSRYITVDIVIPESRWSGREEQYLKRYLSERVRAALVMCADRLERDREPIDKVALLRDVDFAINEFLATPTPHTPWTASPESTPS